MTTDVAVLIGRFQPFHQGHLHLVETALERAERLLILLGSRFSEMPSSSYTLMDIPYPAQKLVHVHPDPSELGRVYRAEVALCATPGAFLAALDALPPLPARRWREWNASRMARPAAGSAG